MSTARKVDGARRPRAAVQLHSFGSAVAPVAAGHEGRGSALRFTLEKHLASLGPLALSAITAERVDELLTRKRYELSAGDARRHPLEVAQDVRAREGAGLNLW